MINNIINGDTEYIFVRGFTRGTFFFFKEGAFIEYSFRFIKFGHNNISLEISKNKKTKEYKYIYIRF